MLEGIEVLHQTDIMGPPGWLLPAIIIGGFVIWLITSLSIGKAKIFDTVCTVLIGFLFGLLYSILMTCFFGSSEPTGRYRYEVTIDESVNFTEVYERFDIIDKRGDIYILEDKKNEQ